MMPLHLLKLCVGVTELEELDRWVKDCVAGRYELSHTTRMFPRRREEILKGGSLYWVIRGLTLCRQPILALDPVAGEDGIERCRIAFAPRIVPVRPQPRRAFQGWRYLEAVDAPPDLPRGAKAGAIPAQMRKHLAELGLL